MRYEEIFDRPRRLIGEDAQRKIMRLKVAVAGCGVLGVVLIAILARMGVSELRLLDNDAVKSANLANNLFLRKEHVGRKKADAAAEVARLWSLRRPRIKPYSLDVTDGDEWDRLNSFVSGVDLVYGCFDNLPARFSLNSAALVQGVKYVDLGIEGFSGRIRLIDRSRACYACDSLVPEDQSFNIYSLTKRSSRSCDYAPTVTILPTAISAAARAAVEGMKFLGILQTNEQYDYLYYSFLTSDEPVRMQVSKDENCVICGPRGLVGW